MPHPSLPLGRRYDIDGRQLMLHHSGGSGPTVVFLAGVGLMSLDYLNIHNRVAELTGSVLYDRAGTGWSDPVDLPRTAAEVTDELHDLLRAAAVPGPYLLAGHSLGGAYARHYARRFPGEVAGLLLLDPFHEDLVVRAPRRARERLEQMMKEMRDQELVELTEEQIRQSRDQMAPHFAAWPEPVRGPLIERHLATWRSASQENQNLYDKVADEFRRAPGTPDVPLIVLSAMGHDATQAHLWPEDLLREINEGKRALHAELAAEAPRGEHRILDDAGHGWLHEERPDAVLQAVNDLLQKESSAT
ncbi:alpha/beta fold hydrolase [Streptomyces natalensis]|uniref:Alpha/beta hydrolase n=1 Tax=Streptomyces natalensis ATCC 27448 TaxID=1240678 RepID=A0A0D7CKG5_9ACTN|nr:alpha/beta hydrolase [Streptomyces natalensis]KIZ15937.1 alpha/beta hydrolase [Streptomyces natalensis ATCC 27448]